MNKEAEYVKKISPMKTQLENIKTWMKNSEKWIKLLEETFNYQKSHIQFVSKWLHEAYKVKKKKKKKKKKIFFFFFTKIMISYDKYFIQMF